MVAAETAARNATRVEPNWHAIHGILTSERHPVDDAAWRLATSAWLRRILTRMEFGTDRTVRTIFRNGEVNAFQFGVEECRMPGEPYSVSNAGWFDGKRDQAGKLTKAGSPESD